MAQLGIDFQIALQGHRPGTEHRCRYPAADCSTESGRQGQRAIEGEHGFQHTAIWLSCGRMICIDRLSGSEVARMKGRSQASKAPRRLRVFHLKTGDELWSTTEDLFGT